MIDGTGAEASAPDEPARPEVLRALEAVLMAATAPAEPRLLAQLLEVPVTEVEARCEELARAYEAEQRGFALVRVAGGYRFQTHPDLAPYVERFVLDGRHARLSGPALETLAIVAYKQPVSRAQIAAIRGVNVDGVLGTLLRHGYVEEQGHDPGPGRATLYGTTSAFLEHLGLDSLAELPELAGFVPGAEVVEALESGLRLRIDVPAPGVPESPRDPGGLGGHHSPGRSAPEAPIVGIEVDGPEA